MKQVVWSELRESDPRARGAAADKEVIQMQAPTMTQMLIVDILAAQVAFVLLQEAAQREVLAAVLLGLI